VQLSHGLSDKNEVVMETTSTDESILVLADKAIKLWGQAQRQNFRCNLADEVHEADGAVIAESLGIRAFWQQGKQGLVELVEASAPELVQLLEDNQYVMLDQGPAGLKEFSSESIRAWRLASRKALDSSPYLVVREWLVELSKVRGGVDQMLQL
jgi:hypothetical protein